MQRLEVSGAVRPIYGSLGAKRLNVWRRKNEENKWSVACASSKQGSFWGPLLIEIILKDDSMAATLAGGSDALKVVGGLLGRSPPPEPPKTKI